MNTSFLSPACQPCRQLAAPMLGIVLAAGLGAAQGPARISGELKEWHEVTLTLVGPFLRESGTDPNPFTDFRFDVLFRHESGAPEYRVPGYFAADGDAANTSGTEGNQWRAHLSPDKPGRWTWRVSFVKGKGAALDDAAKVEPVSSCDGLEGSFVIEPTDKTGRDFRRKGRLQYVGEHYLRFAGSREYFLKAGADAPETLLAYADFDGTEARKKDGPLKTWKPHVPDWRDGDPTWKDGKGKGLIGALNYLAGKGCNAFSFLPYNAGGDGDNVWPFVARDDKLHYDCSKLDQWGIVFDHAQRLGLYLHFKLQETEMDDDRLGQQRSKVPESLDGGALGPERKLYLRELIARFGHALALNWNLGEENTQSPEEQRSMAQFIHDTDPYDHHIIVHTYPGEQDKVYAPLLGRGSVLTGASLQNGWNEAHQRALQWVSASRREGRPWVVANDEQNPPDLGVPPDPGYQGVGGRAGGGYGIDDIRKLTLWGTLMAGGAGVEYYFGYKLPQSDLVCEDWRSRDKSWDYCRIALDFFGEQKIPFWEMENADEKVGNPSRDNSRYCFAKAGEVYVVYLPVGGGAELDLLDAPGTFEVEWYDPRAGGGLLRGSVREVAGNARANLGRPPSDASEDWVVLVRIRRAAR